uniref:Uncharacterized protein n=2 Tax=unclassified Caudoviricetes TaxID=2788787 RepID=A0A8S5UMX8_9CAUD|nr:MAG TPA: hypothetical protein [Siphoviridae sp. ctsus30]DAF95837.1 MAG TPA: hypothetical protein [Siphoviridae sp. ctKGQ3]
MIFTFRLVFVDTLSLAGCWVIVNPLDCVIRHLLIDLESAVSAATAVLAKSRSRCPRRDSSLILLDRSIISWNKALTRFAVRRSSCSRLIAPLRALSTGRK